MEKSATLKFCVKDTIKGGLIGLFCFAVVVGVVPITIEVSHVILDNAVVYDAIDAIANTIASTAGIHPIDAGLFIAVPVIFGIPVLIGGGIYGGILFYTHKKYGRTACTAFALSFFIAVFILNFISLY